MDPSMQQNLRDIFQSYKNKKSNILKDRDFLTDKYQPDNILHRDKEITQLANILAPALLNQKTSNIFIYGGVGTGKSITTKFVTNELKKNSDNIEILFINCKMKKVSDTEYRLLAELTRNLGLTVPATGLPTDEVYKIFFEAVERTQKTVILVLDEIDALIRKMGDDILYNLTRINQDLKVKLSIIGISNDVTFTENLDPRVKSSLSEEEFVFSPYNAHQLYDILLERSKLAFYEGTVDNGVLTKCAALAAQEHGDARKALDLLRVAGELVERAGGSKISIEHIDKAEHKLDFDRTITIVKTMPRQSQAVLASIIKLHDEGQKNIQTGDIFSLYEKICIGRGLKTLTQRRVSDLIADLDMLGLITVKVISKGRYGRTREIRLQLSSSVIKNIKRLLKDNYLLTDSFMERMPKPADYNPSDVTG